ncbi:tRNA guanosine-2'-O-methyltransferase TRM13-like protein [Trichuris trichiura]|uniref:tRNA:m(4)X modification enzyme TRM13 n=1 Tax=Trichuris trichiura TaxID=36087 RepID=A0A077ZB80_TRITR|nr:tRNA guanosine-2'-O-methyltransferase TRM13-like protein [Trichuris trichiura]
MTLDDILRCGLVFDRLDKDHDGRLNASDIAKAMQSIKGHATNDEITEAIRAYDLNGDGTIDFQEFLTLVQRYCSCLGEDQELRVAFRILDRNCDGFIDVDDLKEGMEILGMPVSDEEAQAMIKMGDHNNDGKLNFQEVVDFEFCRMSKPFFKKRRFTCLRGYIYLAERREQSHFCCSPRRCQYFLKEKGRTCRMLTKPDSRYCGEHMIVEDPTARVVCPLDPKHTICKTSLSRHMAVCNARLLSEQPWYRYNVNLFDKNSDINTKGKFERQPVTADQVRLLLDFFAHFGENAITTEVKVFNEINELSSIKFNDTGKRSITDRAQLASILGHLQDNGAFADDGVETCFLEFGAGRGRLSYWISMLQSGLSRHSYVLVEKSGVRYKFENKAIKDHVEKGKFTRIQSPIEHLVLGDVPQVRTASRVVAICKHLCGDAFDAALCCLANSSNDGVMLQTAIMAPCCLHRCYWSNFCGQEALKLTGLNEKDFRAFCTMASWSNSGLGETCESLIQCAACLSKEDRSYCRQCAYVDLVDVGRKAKIAVNLARKSFLEKVGFTVRLVQFVPNATTPENLLLIANKFC